LLAVRDKGTLKKYCCKNCPGEIFFVGECGGVMETAKCPRCKK
jgi:hypothetical protein